MPEPDFVNSFNKEQHIIPTTVREVSIQEQAINEALDLSNRFNTWAKSIDIITKEISEEEFYPYDGEWNQGLELASVAMLAQWEMLSKALNKVVDAHDTLVQKYLKCIEEVQAGESVINLAEKNV